MNHERFMEQALNEARKALNSGEFPVGCVVVYENDVIVTGARTGTRKNTPNEVDHAEIIALKRLSRMDPDIDRTAVTLYSTMEPCLMCFGAAVLCGIREVVYAYEDVMGGGTTCDLSTLTPLYKEHSVNIVPHILREQSLALFKAYFNDPGNDYWKGSLLARYTLDA